MPRPASNAAHALLLRILDESYRASAWHGPTLKGSVRGLSAADASWRPAPGRHCIAEIVVHAAYWKYAVQRRLTGEKRGGFALKGSNWFPSPVPFDEAAWRAALRLLDEQHQSLRHTVARLDAAAISATAPGRKVSNERLIYGIAMHDVYHAGQVQTLKALRRAKCECLVSQIRPQSR
jgi:uncharacterized damage-inducible protein DinB